VVFNFVYILIFSPYFSNAGPNIHRKVLIKFIFYRIDCTKFFQLSNDSCTFYGLLKKLYILLAEHQRM